MEWRVLRNTSRDSEREHLNKILKEVRSAIETGTIPAGVESRPAPSVSYVPAPHKHPLSDLLQSGATVGQVATWNGTAWVPLTQASTQESTQIVDHDGALVVDDNYDLLLG